VLARIFNVAILSLWICGPGAEGGKADDQAAHRDLVNGGTVGIISGGVTGTYVRIAADLANALDDGYELRVLPIIGKGSVRNIEDLVLLRGVDVAIRPIGCLGLLQARGPGVEYRRQGPLHQ